jgi:hypothetical protein
MGVWRFGSVGTEEQGVCARGWARRAGVASVSMREDVRHERKGK